MNKIKVIAMSNDKKIVVSEKEFEKIRHKVAELTSPIIADEMDFLKGKSTKTREEIPDVWELCEEHKLSGRVVDFCYAPTGSGHAAYGACKTILNKIRNGTGNKHFEAFKELVAECVSLKSGFIWFSFEE